MSWKVSRLEGWKVVIFLVILIIQSKNGRTEVRPPGVFFNIDSLQETHSFRTPNEGEVIDWEVTGGVWLKVIKGAGDQGSKTPPLMFPPAEQGGNETWATSSPRHSVEIFVSGLVERENGEIYWGYDLEADHGIGEVWETHYRSRVRTAKDQSDQSITAGRPVYKRMSIGAGVQSSHYSNPKGAMVYSIPLPNGEASYTTDYNQVHIWEVDTWFDIEITERVTMINLARYYRKNRYEDWQVKNGFRIKF